MSERSDVDAEIIGKAVVSVIRNVLGIDDAETVEIRTPQFERKDGIEPGTPPLTTRDMDRLKQADETQLKELGLRKWSHESGLWLLPHEWHPHIPREYPLLNILDEETCRAELPADPDKRHGLLSVGVVPDFEGVDDD